jgi:hypothetical protein
MHSETKHPQFKRRERGMPEERKRKKKFAEELCSIVS